MVWSLRRETCGYSLIVSRYFNPLIMIQGWSANTPKAFANSSPRLERKRQPWVQQSEI
jgi:hypothetical protein